MKNCHSCGYANEDKATVCFKCCAALKGLQDKKEPEKVSKKDKELIEDGTGTEHNRCKD